MPQTMLGAPAPEPDGGALRDDHHGAVRARRERPRDAAEHGRAQRPAAARADDDQAGARLAGCLEQPRRRRALDEADLVVFVQAEPLPRAAASSSASSTGSSTTCSAISFAPRPSASHRATSATGPAASDASTPQTTVSNIRPPTVA